MKKLLLIALMASGTSIFALEQADEYPLFDKALAAAFPSKVDQERIKRDILISIGTLGESIKNLKAQIVAAAKTAQKPELNQLLKALDDAKAQLEKLLNEKLEELKEKAKQMTKN